ncbi:hypothetical protein [Allorhizobium terrae]|uniref:Uncharacterized protein n=1 Tax=Allorhizobium terrae TaxID=1848972 RepID=A0A4S3ZXY0_9HYPH|nr:hypothetical protein [Allorhizobium terrae]THF50775.1 hypothetical protein E6C51_07945 [Allorhizobium terrae]
MGLDIELLETLYQRLLEAGLVQSKVEFSTELLGKGASYLTSMSARERHVPEAVFHSLLERIELDQKSAECRIKELEVEHLRCRAQQYQRKLVAELLHERLSADEPRPGVCARAWLSALRPLLHSIGLYRIRNAAAAEFPNRAV